MALSAMGPSENIQQVCLGCRDVDLRYNWHASSQLYDAYGGIPSLSTFIARMKADDRANTSSAVNKDILTLSNDQQKVIELLQLQILADQKGISLINVPSTAIIQGKAGTGKSAIISKMVQHLALAYRSDSCLILLGPTGVSALNINGATIHSKLLIRTQQDEFAHLDGQQLHAFKNTMKDIKFVIIDEFSMVGCGLMYMIDQRLRQGKENPSEPFGGLFLYMFGDINQLPPVMDIPVYSENQRSMEAIAGKILYDNIDVAFILDEIHRQHDQRFQSILNNFSSGKITRDDYDNLKTRFVSQVSMQERQKFKNAPHFYPTNKEKENFSHHQLSNSKDLETNLKKPVARIFAKVSSKGSKNCLRYDDDDLEGVLYLSKGSRIMLRKNLWTEHGLVNGSVGEVVDIVYHRDATPQEDPPAILICRFESYVGPYLDPQMKTVPLAPTQIAVTDNKEEKCTISQFPVCLCYGCTIHKSQGLTMDKAYVNIGAKEMQAGLSYVALSRVKSMDGLLLEPFDFARCLRLNKSKTIAKRQQWLESLRFKVFSSNT